MAERFPMVEFFAGDITTPGDDLCRAMQGFDTVIHAAAMKDVVLCEEQIERCVATNFTGTLHAVRAAQRAGVERFVYVSTDMAVEPSSVYGQSKALADALVVDASRTGGMKTCVVRFGNILTPRGAIFDTLRRKHAQLGYVPITHEGMSRFFTSSRLAATFLLDCASGRVEGGEVFAPVCQSYDILNVARAVAPDGEVRVVGLRPGDKLYITMISESEAVRTTRQGDRYVVFPTWSAERYGDPVSFSVLTSATNPWRATVDELREFCC